MWWFSCSVVSDFCDPTDCSLPGSSVHGIFQARILEWVPISFTRGSSQSRDRTHGSCISYTAGRFFTAKSPEKPLTFMLLLLLSCFSHVWLCATPQTAAHQAPLSLGFSRQEYWNGLPFPSPPDLHTHGQKAHKKVLNITNYQRNPNQNYKEVIASH